jgi:hypothetical protein
MPLGPHQRSVRLPGSGYPGSRKPAGKCVADLVDADEPLAPRIRPARPLEDGVIGEVGHDPVEVVIVEGRGDRADHLDGVVLQLLLLR